MEEPNRLTGPSTSRARAGLGGAGRLLPARARLAAIIARLRILKIHDNANNSVKQRRAGYIVAEPFSSHVFSNTVDVG